MITAAVSTKHSSGSSDTAYSCSETPEGVLLEWTNLVHVEFREGDMILYLYTVSPFDPFVLPACSFSDKCHYLLPKGTVVTLTQR